MSRSRVGRLRHLRSLDPAEVDTTGARIDPFLSLGLGPLLLPHLSARERTVRITDLGNSRGGNAIGLSQPSRPLRGPSTSLLIGATHLNIDKKEEDADEQQESAKNKAGNEPRRRHLARPRQGDIGGGGRTVGGGQNDHVGVLGIDLERDAPLVRHGVLPQVGRGRVGIGRFQNGAAVLVKTRGGRRPRSGIGVARGAGGRRRVIPAPGRDISGRQLLPALHARHRHVRVIGEPRIDIGGMPHSEEDVFTGVGRRRDGDLGVDPAEDARLCDDIVLGG